MKIARQPHDVRIAWLAGIIEGEGHIRRPGRAKNGRLVPPDISVKMTDEDVVRMLCATARCGRVYGPYETKQKGRDHSKWKPCWVWTLRKRDEFLVIAQAIRPYMSARRKQSLDEAILYLTKRRDFCRSGKHPMKGSGQCMECKRDRDRRNKRKAAEKAGRAQ